MNCTLKSEHQTFAIPYQVRYDGICHSEDAIRRIQKSLATSCFRTGFFTSFRTTHDIINVPLSTINFQLDKCIRKAGRTSFYPPPQQVKTLSTSRFWGNVHNKSHDIIPTFASKVNKRINAQLWRCTLLLLKNIDVWLDILIF